MYLLYCLEAALYGQLKKTLVISGMLSTLPQNLFNSWQVSLSEHGVSESCRSCRHIQNTKILKTNKQKKNSVKKCYDLSNAIWWTDLVRLPRKSRSGREKLIRDKDDLKSSALAWLCLHGNHCLAEEQCVADVWVFCLFIILFVCLFLKAAPVILSYSLLFFS